MPRFLNTIRDKSNNIVDATHTLLLHSVGYYVGYIVSAAVGEFPTDTSIRVHLDLSNATEVRFTSGSIGEFSTNARLRLQYSTDNGANWNYLNDANNGPDLGSIVTYDTKDSGWQAIAAGAKTNILLRVIGVNGDGTTTGYISTLAVHWR